MNTTSDDFDATVGIVDIVSVLLFLTLGSLILTGSLLVVVAVWRFPNLQTATNKLVVSLACSDLMVGTCLLFLSIYHIHKKLHLLKFWCVIRYVPITISLIASTLNLFFISCDRFIVLTRPLHYPLIVTPRRINSVVCFTWVFSISMGLLLFHLNTFDELQECVFEILYDKAYLTGLMITQIALTLIIIAIYVKIFLIAYEQQRKVWDLCDNTISLASHKKHMKSIKVLAMVVGAFIICWSPFVVITIIEMLFFVNDAMILVSLFVFFLALINSVLNPIIYAWKNSEFRTAFKKLLHIRSSAVGTEASRGY